MREQVITFNGEKLVEIFDIPAADLHMMANYLEYDNNVTVPESELLEFQKKTKEDFRKQFGIDEKTGKCTKTVKEAFKIYFNLQDERKYKWTSKIVKTIDNYFKTHFPTIREWIIHTKDIWKRGAEEEYKIVSCKMFKQLIQIGIFNISCHDAIYVLKSDAERTKQIINKIFYNNLNLLIDRKAREEAFYNL